MTTHFQLKIIMSLRQRPAVSFPSETRSCLSWWLCQSPPVVQDKNTARTPGTPLSPIPEIFTSYNIARDSMVKMAIGLFLFLALITWWKFPICTKKSISPWKLFTGEVLIKCWQNFAKYEINFRFIYSLLSRWESVLRSFTV